MKRVLILYKSKYGAAKKYAGMIKEALGGDVFDVKDFEKADLVQYDSIGTCNDNDREILIKAQIVGYWID